MPRVSLSELVAAAQAGDRLLSFPTDTVPALATRPDHASLIYAAKERRPDKPLILMGGDARDLWPYVRGSEAEHQCWQQVTECHWPGGLTLVLPASDRLPPQMNPTDPTTIGIRVPDRAIARHILRLTGPLATTSVNKSGQPPLQTLEAIAEQFPEVLCLEAEAIATLEQELLATEPGLASSSAGSGVPSTVARWTGAGWDILRQGAVVV